MADHNLDLSLGGSSSKQGSQELGDNRGQNSSSIMQLDIDWQRHGLRPEVYLHDQ